MSISEKEYFRRYSGIRELMKEDGLDSLLVFGLSDDFNRGNIRYITGYGRGGCCIFPLEGTPVFFINSLQAHSPKLPKSLEAFNLLDLRETNGYATQAVKELSSFDKGNKIGLIGMGCISVPIYLAIKEKFGERIIDLPEIFEPLRAIKSGEEIEKTRTAASIADKVFLRLREIIRPGLSEGAIYGEVKKVIYTEGCEYSFDLIDGAGSTMNMAYFPTKDHLEQHGTLFMEISPSYEGYYAQLPVTLPVGKYVPRAEQMVRAWARADREVQKLLRPGSEVSEIYHSLIDSIHQSGFISPLRPGHSLGLDILDFWSITESNHTVLRPGMIIAVHPCAMVKVGEEGVGLGYTYLITETGAEKLSKIDLARELVDGN